MKTNKNLKQTPSDKVLVIGCLSAVLGLVGCQQEGSAEKAGQKIDQAAENAGQKIEKATEKAEIKIDAAKESLDKKADAAKESINESTEASKGALENAGKKLDQATENAEKKIEGAKDSVVDKAQTAGEFIDDSMITTTVKTAILGDSLLRSSHIEVTTVNGVVKLSGTVDSDSNLLRAKEVAIIQKNVKSVQTDLIVTITPSTK
ncbi:MAG: BON domain-containing protein [Methylococcaceae bacterium]|nr:BON domain-containing protein [Methylococcaceae bacterium]